jgi:hypothetical protein
VSHELTSDDEALLTALAVLEQDPDNPPGRAPAGAGGLPADSAAGGRDGAAEGAGGGHVEAVDTLTRLYHEALGLIPSSLPPMVPSPEVKRRLMAAISAGGSAARPAKGDAACPAEPLPFAPPAAPAAPPAPPAITVQVTGRGAGSGSRSWLTLAAALILGLLGVSGWLFHGLTKRDEAVARLTAQRAEALQQVSDAEARLRRAEVAAKSMRQSFSVVTSPAVEVCALRPSSPMPAVAGAHGILFVAADHQHWYMSLRGLQPAGAGKVYQLWFIGAQGPVSAGTFTGDPGTPWELGSEHMPPDTREVRITVEDGAGSPAPRGQEVLRNTDLFRVL